MTSREIIHAVLDFADPPRIGLALHAPHPNDLSMGGRRAAAPVALEPRGGELRRWRDEWGVVWASLTEFDKGEVVAPALAEWADLDAYEPPDLGRAEDWAGAREQFAADTQRFRIAGIPGFTFNVARKLRRLDNYLCDLMLEPAHIARLHDIVRAELLKAIECGAAAGADAIMFWEDWGTQDRLMVSPQMWREVFKPEFLTLAGRAREHGLRVIMHSCGKMTAIIDDLIDCGIDALQFDQPRLHGIGELGERFAGRMTFWCPVDIQRTLQTRDERLIRQEAKELIARLSRRRGGFIAGRYPSDEAIGLDSRYQDVASEAFVEFAAGPA